MKKRRHLMFLSALLCVLFLPLCASAEGMTKNYRSSKWNFSVRIPAGFNVTHRTFKNQEFDRTIAGGFIITPDGADDAYQVRVVRMDHPFNNPGHYLTSEFYQYLDDRSIYYFDTESAWYTMGGKTLYGTWCSYTDEQEKPVREFRLIEPGGDTEYMARYSPDDEAAALELLDTVIGSTSQDPAPEQPEAKIRPVTSEPDLMNGTFLLRIEDADKITSEARFTAALYERDIYSAEDVYAIQPGDTILINDRVFTILDFEPWELDDGTWHQVSLTVDYERPEQEYSGFCLESADDHFVMYFGNDDYSSHRVASVPVQLPLPDTFEYYDIPGGDYPELKPTDTLLEQLQSSYAMIYLTQYNTSCRFKDGQLIRIDSWNYPFGPTDWIIP